MDYLEKAKELTDGWEKLPWATDEAVILEVIAYALIVLVEEMRSDNFMRQERERR